MMNRIILIGNGFDLAHRLKTSYADFIKYYWTERLHQLLHTEQMETDDGLCIYKIPNTEIQKYLYQLLPYVEDSSFYYSIEKHFRDLVKRIKQEYSSKFFEEINKAIDTYNWVDIEAEYYHWLTKIFKQSECEYADPNKLNDELKLLKDNFIVYLAIIQTDFIKPELKIESIANAIYESFDIKDMSNESQSIFKEFVENRWNTARREDKSERRAIACRYGYSMRNKEYELKEYIRLVSDLSGHWNNMQNGPYTTPNYFLLPDQILLLNFNYTSTADLYIPKGSDFKVNHIHGELGNDNNPVIFGYGDEMDEYYKKISNLNNNAYLKNIKSIRYLETDNYRKLLSFIDSAPFQIYIMGHSCGNSDRTLLNTLFEHKNCVSIKPFFHQKDDGTDNYIEIIQNISRNFNNMQLMRDRVVNKTYCRPLVPQAR